jgi:AcrR family transcriptional regulator
MSENISESSFTSQPAAAPLSRRERKKERTRQEIYRAAMELFLARSFDSVTIEDICAAADVAKGTFFLHFPTKDALLLEYGVQVTQELDTLLRSHQSGATAALQKILTFLTERATQHAAVVQLLVREVMMHPVAFVEVTKQSRNLGHLFADIVRQGQSNGEFRSTIEPRLAAALITSAYFSILNEWGRSGGKFALTAALQQALDIVLHGLAEKQALSHQQNQEKKG